jgi:hypothetical protein
MRNYLKSLGFITLWYVILYLPINMGKWAITDLIQANWSV